MGSIGISLIGIIVIGGGFAGLVMIELEREQHSIYSDTGETVEFRAVQILEPDHTYLIVVSLEDTYSYTSQGYLAIVNGTSKIYIDGVLAQDTDLYDREWREEDDTGVDAYDSTSYEFTPTSSTNVTVVGTLIYGEEWSVIIYRDLPADIDSRSGTQIVIMLVGMVLFIAGIGIFIKVRRS